MTNEPNPHAQFDRRALLKGATAAGLASTVAQLPAAASAAPAARSSAVNRENAQPGTTDWQLTFTRIAPKTRYRSPAIEGFVSRASVKAGETLDLMVSTNPAGPFKVNIYRLGYYGGTGGWHVESLGPFDGVVQDDPPVGDQRLRECRWTPCTTLTVPANWPSGVYLGKLSLINNRYQSYVIFIVREDRPADVAQRCRRWLKKAATSLNRGPTSRTVCLRIRGLT